MMYLNRKVSRGRPSSDSLNSRGGTEASEFPINDEERTKALAAISNMELCWKASFFSAIADGFTTLLELDIKTFKLMSLQTFVLIKTLYKFGFGMGILRVSLIYGKILRSNAILDESSIFDMCKTMARLWRQSAWIVVAGAIVTSTELKEYTGDTVWIYAAPGGITILAIFGSFILRLSSAAAAKKASEGMSLPKRKAKSQEGEDAVDMASARSMGFLAARNMKLCMGSFCLIGLTHLVTTISKPSSFVALAFGLSDVFGDVIFVRLLHTLNHNFLRGVVIATGKKPENYKRGLDIGFYEAQRSFYSEVSSTFFIETMTKLFVTLYVAVKFLTRTHPSLVAVELKISSFLLSDT